MPPSSRAVLVGVLTPGRAPASLGASLDELGRLCDTLGLQVVGRMTQRRSSTKAQILLGEGRLKALAAWTGGSGEVARGPAKPAGKKAFLEAYEEELPPDPEQLGDGPTPEGPAGGPEAGDEAEEPEEPGESRISGRADEAGRRCDVVVVDHELSPNQLRNLKSALGVEVLDRTGVIIEIFHSRARSPEARLQVELARLMYLAPRLRELGGPSERQRGGIGGKGAGETALELDRRRVRDRMAEIRRELRELDADRGTRRARRHELRQVALVGYTNAGKSSLMRALTGAGVYVADQLFATLDTTVRRLHPDVSPPVLVTDTVGFIQDLPHSLVASFRSTLDAALDAALLLHVVDASDPTWREQERVTAEVLSEIQAEELPRVLVFNKCDRLPAGAEAALAAERPDAWFTAAHDPARVAQLHAQIAAFFDQGNAEAELFVPWTRAALMGRVRDEATVVDEAYEDEGVRYRLRGPAAALEKLAAAARG